MGFDTIEINLVSTKNADNQNNLPPKPVSTKKNFRQKGNPKVEINRQIRRTEEVPVIS